MWRTLIVNQGEKITLENGTVKIISKEDEVNIPIQDIYSVVIDNRAALVSVNVLAALSEVGAHIYYCNDKHIPVGVTVPYNRNFQPLAVIKKQLSLSNEMKDLLWQKIVKQKIDNQAKCLHYARLPKEKIEIIENITGQVLPGDANGCEAKAAKKYFQYLYGSMFVRRKEDVTNYALNYGYTIFRSTLCKILVGYGFNCILGLHHHSEQNEFNLADDIIEPFRPVVDLWVDDNCENLFETLTQENRKGLINLINVPILMDGKRMRVRNAMDLCVNSLVSSIDKNNPDLLKLPKLLPWEIFDDED